MKQSRRDFKAGVVRCVVETQSPETVEEFLEIVKALPPRPTAEQLLAGCIAFYRWAFGECGLPENTSGVWLIDPSGALRPCTKIDDKLPDGAVVCRDFAVWRYRGNGEEGSALYFACEMARLCVELRLQLTQGGDTAVTLFELGQLQERVCKLLGTVTPERETVDGLAQVRIDLREKLRSNAERATTARKQLGDPQRERARQLKAERPGLQKQLLIELVATEFGKDAKTVAATLKPIWRELFPPSDHIGHG